MSVLAALVRAYERMAERGEVPPFGYSYERIGFLIALRPDGTVAGQPIDLRLGDGRNRTSRPLPVPQPSKRTSGIAPNFLWDKTAYVLGVTAGEGKRTLQEHRAFREQHRTWLAGTEDEGLRALLRFLDAWRPKRFAEWNWPEEMIDQNLAFALESERLLPVHLHDRTAARAVWTRLMDQGGKTPTICLVSGERAPPARLHPAIKGVSGAQSSGASIVSFNLDAFSSYGHQQGANAPISAAAALAYGTALNRFLDHGSGHRLRIGDTTVVYWAEATDPAAAAAAEQIFADLLGAEDSSKSGCADEQLEMIAQGRPINDAVPALPTAVRFHLLGLSPNAARLSVRFYIEDDFELLAKRYLEHLQRLRIVPPPREPTPSLRRYLIETAVLRKSENVSPRLAGDWLRAILTGTHYPLTMLSALIMRLRADHDVNALRVGLMKSILIQNFRMEVPVALDPDCINKGYLLGRLFAVYEHIQTTALGHHVNSTIKDKFYGAASAQPRKVFRLLDSGSSNYLSRIGKHRMANRISLERAVGEIMDAMSPGDDPFPASLPEKEQALFSLGYYHQRNEFFRKRQGGAAEIAA